ncbi:hypothetical protein EMIHUDRAFT_315231 [Emiliania huxleyi CCMP1516]|uniref:AAA+ ATPase domain-containing protein n=2 Tax=Emiliania huxleyi TaxID=2903 RepID=A0A0D3JR53_EMIH1|nr:hypothetical protein EMIHUDRAFT_315231 [Emiliania huxleyi CCMP1516]EOD25988.1 hypothetical protein EMIHUDRAFT_315231 [Emiliania huxleyi CCMP1516]|mmetsp:Transcript_72/g.240  ORF Transcript_72/g.240 Transcript_72/m.240 type:complete len:308 (+) Transcript_72:498-1421(+)|eukprot:XP_005778417.1 hypothetical protein EMIHUDRAFT_315231 [Emiliania huxleyi CCMP1516]
MAASPELRELAAVIQRDMVQSNPNVRWDRIVELEGVKRVLKESLVMPLRWPHLFTGLLAPWKGVLLYGPPGTGKTLLAKAVATECSTVFFNISASSIVSKWRGDSEKLVRVLFDLARHHAPSTIFIDEIDSIMSARGDSGEHEGSRRMKTELLVQMDGLMANEAQVFVLAATNLPWELDAALLRRLEKRVLVPLPSSSARAEMLRNTLPPARIQRSVDIDGLADQADGYSGSDLVLVCKEAAMRPLRKLLLTLDAADAAMGSGKVADLPQPERVTEEDLRAAFACTRPTVSQYGSRYAEWEAEFGSS